jgi:hypothetical protein
LSAEPVELQRIAPENLIKIYFSVVKLFWGDSIKLRLHTDMEISRKYI